MAEAEPLHHEVGVPPPILAGSNRSNLMLFTPSAPHEQNRWLTRLVRRARVEVSLLDARHFLSEGVARALPQFTFNHTRTLILRAAGLDIGPRSLVMGPLRLTGSAHYRDLFSMGCDTMITGPLHANLGAKVTIGSRVHLGHGVTLLTIES